MHENERSIEMDWRELEPPALADHLERLPVDEAVPIFMEMTPAQRGAVVVELAVEDAVRLLETLPDADLAASIESVPRNLAADIIGMLPPERRVLVLDSLPPIRAAAVSALLRYPPESAGGIMDNRFIAVPADESVDECLSRVRNEPARRSDDVSYIYVTDNEGRLVGVVSLRELVFASGERRVRDIMNTEVQFLRVTDDQEVIARLMQHTSFLGFPVVDELGRLVGVVRIRDAIHVVQTEATEDMQLMVGMSGEERLLTPWRQSVAKRLPWLGINLLTTGVAGAVISVFEDTISRWTALVIFLPLISAVGGNAGIQALTVIIRGFALGEITPGDAIRALRKEFLIGAVNGFVLGVAIGFVSFGWKGSMLLGLVCGGAMLLNQIIGALAGVLVPFGLRRCNIDPALASSIFVTTLTDVLGFLVFLGLAAAVIHFHGTPG